MPFFPRLILDDEMIDDLVDMLDAKASWNDIANLANDCDAASNVRAFSRHVADGSEFDFVQVFSVLNGLWNLRRGMMIRNDSSEEFVESLTRAIEKSSSKLWTEDRMKAWNAFKPDLLRLLDSISVDSSLMLSSKAQFLSYDRSSVFRRARIITDARPVFDSAGQTIKEMMVLHTLVLEFDDRSGTNELYVALDAVDLQEVREACDRADKKANAIVQEFSTPAHGWRTVVSPEVADEE